MHLNFWLVLAGVLLLVSGWLLVVFLGVSRRNNKKLSGKLEQLFRVKVASEALQDMNYQEAKICGINLFFSWQNILEHLEKALVSAREVHENWFFATQLKEAYREVKGYQKNLHSPQDLDQALQLARRFFKNVKETEDEKFSIESGINLNITQEQPVNNDWSQDRAYLHFFMENIRKYLKRVEKDSYLAVLHTTIRLLDYFPCFYIKEHLSSSSQGQVLRVNFGKQEYALKVLAPAQGKLLYCCALSLPEASQALARQNLAKYSHPHLAPIHHLVTHLQVSAGSRQLSAHPLSLFAYTTNLYQSSLEEYAEKKKNSLAPGGNVFERMDLAEEILLYFSQTIKGLAHLHSLQAYHGNVCANNILLQNRQAALADYFLALFPNQSPPPTIAKLLAETYPAEREFSISGDLQALGETIRQVCFCPKNKKLSWQEIREQAYQNLPGQQLYTCLALIHLAERLTSEQPEQRPTIDTTRELFEEIRSATSDPQQAEEVLEKSKHLVVKHRKKVHFPVKVKGVAIALAIIIAAVLAKWGWTWYQEISLQYSYLYGGKEKRLRVLAIEQLRSYGFRNFEKVNLSYCNLSGVDLSYANLQSADLTEANLSGANLLHADLKSADLTGAKLKNVQNLTVEQLGQCRDIENIHGLPGSFMKKIKKRYPQKMTWWSEEKGE